METKTEKAVELLKAGEFSKALSIISRFKIGFTKEQMRILQISSDISKGNGRFYSSIGIDTVQVLHDCRKILEEKYGVA